MYTVAAGRHSGKQTDIWQTHSLVEKPAEAVEFIFQFNDFYSDIISSKMTNRSVIFAAIEFRRHMFSRCGSTFPLEVQKHHENGRRKSESTIKKLRTILPLFFQTTAQTDRQIDL